MKRVHTTVLGATLKSLLLAAFAFWGPGAWALTCDFTTAPPATGAPFSYYGSSTAPVYAYDTGATLTVTCTRTAAEIGLGSPRQREVSIAVVATVSNQGVATAPYRRLVRAGSVNPSVLDFLYYAVGENGCSATSGAYVSGAPATTLIYNNGGTALRFANNSSATVASATFRVCALVLPSTTNASGQVNQTFPTAASTYTDTMQLRVDYSYANELRVPVTGSSPPRTVTLSGVVPSSCTLSSSGYTLSPSPVNYQAFSATAQSASTNLTVRCTNGTPWNLSLADFNANPNAGFTLVGLQYNIRMATTNPASVPAPSLNSTGTGATQGVSVTATFPAGQAGQCAVSPCTGQAVHTLMLTN